MTNDSVSGTQDERSRLYNDGEERTRETGPHKCRKFLGNDNKNLPKSLSLSLGHTSGGTRFSKKVVLLLKC